MARSTIYDIASRAGVGIATVSRVLNDSNRVSDKTRLAVQKAIEELGFRPNHAARRLAAGAPHRPRVLALMPLHSARSYFALIEPLCTVLANADIDLLLSDVRDDKDTEQRLERLLSERSCEAVVLCDMRISEEHRRRFVALNIPVIAIDAPIAEVPHASANNSHGGALLAQHLLQCGARQIALVAGSESSPAYAERERGFVDAMAGPVKLVRCPTTSTEAGRKACATLLTEFPEVDGIACVDDTLAAGVLAELYQRGIRVPQAIQVIGFDDQPLMDTLGLTSVHCPMAQFGEWAGQMAVSLITQPTAAPPSNLLLPVTLVHRATTRGAAALVPLQPSPRTPAATDRNTAAS